MPTAIGVQQVLRGLVFDAEVTAWTSPTSFTAPGLAGQGAGFFIGWSVYVVRDIGGLGAAPQGESQVVSGYDATSGRITHAAFTTPLTVGDSVYLIHPGVAVMVAGGGSPGLAYYGRVTAVPGANQFTIATLAGIGAGKFADVTNPYSAFVFRDAGGGAAAPQGESQAVTAYATVSGTFTTPAFTAPVAVDDEILIVHPAIAYALQIPAFVQRTQGLFYYGVVTDVPGANQFTIATLAGQGANKFIDLAGANPYYAFVARDGAGGGAAPQSELRAITGYATLTGNFTAAAFSAAVAVGDEMLILHPSLARIFNTAGVPGTNGNLAANWQAAEQNLCIIGAALTRYKVYNLTIGIAALVGNITIRMYTDVNGVDTQIYPLPLATTFNVATDPPGIPIINSFWAIKNALRVTVQSDAVADNGAVVSYDYLLEAM